MSHTTFSDFCQKPNPDVITAALFQAQTAVIGLAHKVKMYEDALNEIAWSNNSEWQQDRAKQVLAQMRGVDV